jgi:hypothetical protein
MEIIIKKEEKHVACSFISFMWGFEIFIMYLHFIIVYIFTLHNCFIIFAFYYVFTFFISLFSHLNMSLQNFMVS